MKRILVLLAASSVFAWAHEGHDHGAEPSPAATVRALPLSGQRTQRLADGSVFVPKPAQRTLALRTVLAEAGEFGVSIELNGRVIADPALGGRVQAAQSSRVEAPPRGLPRLGQRVQRGELLATLVHIEDPVERARQQVMVHETQNQLDVAQKRQRRHLEAPGYFPRREVEETRLEIASLERRLVDLKSSISGREALLAPATGIIAASYVAAGQVVEARELLFEIIDPQHLMIEAQAFDPTLVSSLTTASASAADGRPIPLRFVGGGRSLREGALPLLFAVDATAGMMLALGQPLKLVARSRAVAAGVAVPATAVVPANAAGEGNARVWLHTRAEIFEPRTVQVAPLDATRLRVVSGLTGGERVVIQGAPLLGQVR
jgi:hypothetical protein